MAQCAWCVQIAFGEIGVTPVSFHITANACRTLQLIIRARFAYLIGVHNARKIQIAAIRELSAIQIRGTDSASSRSCTLLFAYLRQYRLRQLLSVFRVRQPSSRVFDRL